MNRPPDYGDLRVGEDINVDDISTIKAFKIFRRLELEDDDYNAHGAETGGRQVDYSDSKFAS